MVSLLDLLETAWQALSSGLGHGVPDAVHAGALECGLRWTDAHIAEGRVQGVRVNLTLETVGAGRRKELMLTLRVPPLPTDLKLARDGVLAQLVGAAELEVGDRGFDDRVRLRANDLLTALVVLDPATRDAVADAVGQDLAFDGGWSFEGPARSVGKSDLVRRVRTMVKVQNRMEEALKRDPIAAIRTRARSDRSAATRRLALALMLERGMLGAADLEAGHADPDAGVRLWCAEQTEDAGPLFALLRKGSRTFKARAAAALAERAARLTPPELREVAEALAVAAEDPELADLAGRARARLVEIGQPMAGAVSVAVDPLAGGLSVATGGEGGLSEAPTTPTVK